MELAIEHIHAHTHMHLVRFAREEVDKFPLLDCSSILFYFQRSTFFS